MRLSLKTAAAALAMDWTNEVKGHLRLDTDDEKARVEAILMPAAIAHAEAVTQRQLINATWTLYLDVFPADSVPIELPKPPLSSVTSVKYNDASGTQQTWSATNYTVDKPAGDRCVPGRIVPNLGVTYPSTYGQPNDVEIEYVAGYGAAYTSVPTAIRAAMLLLVAEQFERREEAIVGTIINTVPLASDRLLWPYRVWM